MDNTSGAVKTAHSLEELFDSLFSRTSFLMGAAQTEHHRDVSPSVVKVRTVKKGSEKIISSEEICF